ncbi:protein IQ-DOMAIN 31 [Punica granatum]|uniref:Uncharacterized protein n=2 Tax=Punica granatum TaxID=22663 RepID=A0A218W659_PUNGR|nr:protein IQ-DOMAIN 31 [Punica granatum]OWM68255.1 hypothetical protein CDL15_Pgr004737 [Punica granatum]PKI74442.1 hypothetical protein CRG98_005206 [Punica granatum]
MGSPRNWLRSIRSKVLCRPTRRDIIVVSANHDPGLIKQRKEEDDDDDERGDANVKPMRAQPLDAVSELQARNYTEEDEAVIRIQAVFRGHLARRAFRALRSLVRLQALARGAYVRKQAEIAQQCIHALVRLQVRVRARQLLGNFDG